MQAASQSHAGSRQLSCVGNRSPVLQERARPFTAHIVSATDHARRDAIFEVVSDAVGTAAEVSSVPRGMLSPWGAHFRARDMTERSSMRAGSPSSEAMASEDPVVSARSGGAPISKSPRHRNAGSTRDEGASELSCVAHDAQLGASHSAVTWFHNTSVARQGQQCPLPSGQRTSWRNFH